MKHRLLYAYPSRFTFLLIACITAAALIQVQSLLGYPAWLRRLLS